MNKSQQASQNTVAQTIVSSTIPFKWSDYLKREPNMGIQEGKLVIPIIILPCIAMEDMLNSGRVSIFEQVQMKEAMTDETLEEMLELVVNSSSSVVDLPARKLIATIEVKKYFQFTIDTPNPDQLPYGMTAVWMKQLSAGEYGIKLFSSIHVTDGPARQHCVGFLFAIKDLETLP